MTNVETFTGLLPYSEEREDPKLVCKFNFLLSITPIYCIG